MHSLVGALAARRSIRGEVVFAPMTAFQRKGAGVLETDRPYPTSLTFMPTPLEVAESSIVALIIFSVFVTTNTALLQCE